MSDYINTDLENKLKFSIHNKIDRDNIAKVCKALSVSDRLRILSMLSVNPMNLYQLSVNLAIPISSVSNHINILSEAGLVMTSYQPTPKGHAKVCSKAVLSAVFSFEDLPVCNNENYSVEMPVGMFSECDINPPCGMLSATQQLGRFDSPAVFYSAQRNQAELIWFNTGYISYRFPLECSENEIQSITFSFEACSETVYYNNTWKSDITVSINDNELLTYTSPGDFGGRRGIYSPLFWPITSTQFGQLKTVQISSKGLFLDGICVNHSINLSSLGLDSNPFIKFTLEVKADALHSGGINLFGKNFGDYPQAVVMTVTRKATKKQSAVAP